MLLTRVLIGMGERLANEDDYSFILQCIILFFYILNINTEENGMRIVAIRKSVGDWKNLKHEL